ncbi:AAA family ATPase [Bizionia gelidisalsuginis]|uniref:AAA family ATPase n=1 Tax=Bizionia gelidisalsuginis TaxID=291188 RepID=A0ABY3MBX4_9FLAO|nr:AAA family ATPase [Bizionia gelidisalsuginis]TYC14803.1 AAA family ATPase [Bizionia gelidisalsuginis]
MKISELKLQNFRGYKEFVVNFNPKFNLIIGENGSGKTALLEALTVAMGSFFLGIRNTNARSIYKKDIHIANYDYSEEYLFPVRVEASGIVLENNVNWARELNGTKNRTTTTEAEELKRIGKRIEAKVREGEQENLPLLTYYATGRLFDEARNMNGKEKSETIKAPIASRFRAYSRCLEAKSTHKDFQKWFRGKELARIQRGQTETSLDVVKKAIVDNIPNCKNIFFEFDPDKPQGLKIELQDGRVLPFNMLSDGTRNFFAIVADIAFKCVTLNPHLQENALTETKGIVLIDELDLHLHPEWQRKIVHVLKDTFPDIQFIVTTHSPFIIQETGEEELIVLKENAVNQVTSGINLSIEDIAEELQEVDNPQWSKSRQEMFEVASKYYKAVKEGTDTAEMKAELDEAMKPFSLDTAFYAIIEQEKIIQEYKKNKQ